MSRNIAISFLDGMLVDRRVIPEYVACIHLLMFKQVTVDDNPAGIVG